MQGPHLAAEVCNHIPIQPQMQRDMNPSHTRLQELLPPLTLISQAGLVEGHRFLPGSWPWSMHLVLRETLIKVCQEPRVRSETWAASRLI